MHEIKIAQYRAEAEVCTSPTSARWLKVTADWTRMAEELEAKINPPRPKITRDSGN